MTGDTDLTLLAAYAYLLGLLEKKAKEENRLAYIHLVEARVKFLSADIDAGSHEQGTNEFAYSI